MPASVLTFCPAARIAQAGPKDHNISSDPFCFLISGRISHHGSGLKAGSIQQKKYEMYLQSFPDHNKKEKDQEDFSGRK